MQQKIQLRKKYSVIRKKNYYEIAKFSHLIVLKIYKKKAATKSGFIIKIIDTSYFLDLILADNRNNFQVESSCAHKAYHCT